MTIRRLLTASALLLVLGGCTINIQHPGQACAPCQAGNGTGDPKAPQVLVSNGTISVDQDVLRFGKEQKEVLITWRLVPAKGTGRLTFPENGVVFERAAADEIVRCQRIEDGAAFTCLNRHTKPGVYRYGINVNEDGKPLKPLDPYVWNE